VKKVNERAQKGIVQSAHKTLEAFRLNWKIFLGIHITVSLLSLLVLTPLLTLLMGWLFLTSGHAALTDEDILFFALSPTGMLVMLLAGAMFTTVVILEQAAMITAAFHVTSGRTVSLSRIGHYLLPKFWPLFKLSLQMIGRTVLVAAPFLAMGAWVYLSLLTEFDINYYLAEKPPVFWKAGGLILLCLLAMAGVLLRVFSGWILALPFLVLGGESPVQALKKSRTASVSNRILIAVTLLVLFLLNAGMLGLVSLLTDFAVDGVVVLAGESLKTLAYLLGGLVILWLVAEVAVTFFGNSILGLAIIYFYVRLAGIPDNRQPIPEPAPAQPGSRRRLTYVRLASLAVITGLLAGLALNITMGKLSLEDNTMIIAHRGASAEAPENTLAALELAIVQQADWVEIDVQETRNGEIVVIHDSDLKKIGGSSLKVAEASLAELQSIDIGSWKDPSFSDQRIPTLQQVLDLCKNRVNIVIELKYYGHEERLEERVASLVEAAGMQDQVMLMSLSYPGIRTMKSLRPDWTVGLLSSVAVGDITRLEADFFAVNAKFANRAFIKRVHKKNQKVMVWTVNDPVSMSAMMSKGVDGLITDNPGLASTIRTERAELGMHERVMIQLASLVGRQPVRPEQ
jgi:glycerophosphoryl diester phosphodiesterase